MPRRRLSQSELKVWRKVAGTVTPLEPKAKSKTVQKEETLSELLGDKHHMDAPVSRVSRKLSKRVAPKPSVSQTKKPNSPAADRAGERRVRRGRVEIEGSLDLHGYTQDSAHMALQAFVAFHRAQGARCVLVITGKGKAGQGVIRKHFLDWLNASDVRAHVSSYAQAHQKHGGGGAFYVFLKRPDKRH